MKAPIKLHWAGGRRGEINYGDCLSRVLVEVLAKREVVHASPATADLCAIGSILRTICQRNWKRPFAGRLAPLQVWGTGTISNATLRWSPFLKYRAVRGPKTRQLAGLPDNVPLGDPGLLAPLTLKSTPGAPKCAIGLVPHMVDIDDPGLRALSDRLDHCRVIDLRNPDIDFVTGQIAACECVLSSSLHGLIVADAFNIPNARLVFSDRILGGDWKFEDYFLSVGREIVPPLIPDRVMAKNVTALVQAPDLARIDPLSKGLVTAFKNMGLS